MIFSDWVEMGYEFGEKTILAGRIKGLTYSIKRSPSREVGSCSFVQENSHRYKIGLLIAVNARTRNWNLF
jgi:hypothetical protein